MENYIFLTNQYLPEPGATGLCVHKIAKFISETGGNVHTICFSKKKQERYMLDGVEVINIDSKLFNCKNRFRRIGNFIELCRKLALINKYPLKSNRFVDMYTEEVLNLLKSKQNATLIASYTPLEACIAAARIKKMYPERIKSVYYSLDTLSNEQGKHGILPASYRISCGIKWERELFNYFDKIILMDCHLEHYSKNVFNQYRKKFYYSSFPLIEKFTSNMNITKDNGVTRIVYAGTLYKILRNPRKACELFCELSKKIPLEVIFMGGGDCEDIISYFASRSGGAIKYLGMQSHEYAQAYMLSADILLSLGNYGSPMAPSKIYEYMSTGKPIIHFYSSDNDPCIKPLKRYNCSYLLNNSSMIDIEDVLYFVKNVSSITFEDVHSIFPSSSPEYTANIIMK